MAERESKSSMVPAALDAGEEEPFEFVEDPEFDVDDKGSCKYEVRVQVPASNVHKQREEYLEELQREAELPGFRRGRAPKKLLERKLGKAVQAEVDSKLAKEALGKLLEEREWDILGTPEFEGLEESQERDLDSPLSFVLKFEIQPYVVELCDYKGLEIERPVVTVKDADVDQSVEELRNRFAVYETVEEGKAEEGDQVIIDFEGTIGGEPFQGGSASNYPYILGTQRFFPEFEEVLLGVSPGDETSCEVTLSDSLPNEELRGKRAQFAIKVKELKRRQMPELTDEFARQVGFEDLPDMRAKVTERLRENSMETSDRIAKNRAIEKIVESSTFEMPDSVVNALQLHHYNAIVREKAEEGLSSDEIAGLEEQLQEEARQRGIREVKMHVAMNKIGELEHVEISDEELEAQAESLARSHGISTSAAAQFINQERGQVVGDLFRQKALDSVLKHAKITDKEVEEESLTDEENEAPDVQSQ